ncbi:MAG: enoyl-CoA hydratase [Natronomonas sp.]|jgi:enoyl-CoA hydratase/carnithine racemase|uniref:enoyl-CoA hydratase/isomerase family protein n=1 Tax=Natronomonas sp. TaxID=2184060 RepID=UPI003988E61D
MIDIDDQGTIRVVTLDRPDRRNALTPSGLEALEAAVDDPPASVIYLRGAGEAFSAGADLEAVATLADDADEGEVEAFVRRGQRTADAIEASSAVVVAGVDGAARGGGVELAAACDLRIATPQATFAEPGVTFGLFGAWGGTVRLPEIIGLGDALDLSLSGRVIDSQEAQRIGLVSRIVEEPRTVAEAIAGNDPAALEHIKTCLRSRENKREREDGEVAAFEALVDAHADTLQELGGSP